MNKKLYRSENDRKIAGVCGGVAEYFKIDSSFVRIAFALGIIFCGFGLLLYLLMWFIIPTRSRVL